MEHTNIIYLEEATYEQEVKNSEVPVIVDFYADWCGPCQSIAPILNDLSDKYAGKVKVCKINIDEHKKLAIENKVMSIPTLFFMKDGDIVKRITGAIPQSEMETIIDTLI